jgi:hypothetical protein
VSGTVVAANDALSKEPDLVNADPFRRGWAVKLGSVSEPAADQQDLKRGQDALAWFKAEVDRFLATVLGDVVAVPAMADGGVITGDVYQRIDHGTWLRVKAALEGSRS